jgi:hypothetical protein
MNFVDSNNGIQLMPRMPINLVTSLFCKTGYLYICGETGIFKTSTTGINNSSGFTNVFNSSTNLRYPMTMHPNTTSAFIFYCGLRNGLILSIDERIQPKKFIPIGHHLNISSLKNQYGSTTGCATTVCSLPHCIDHIDSLTLFHEFHIVVQDITGKLSVFDIRKPGEEAINEISNGDDITPLLKRRFWISNDERVITAPIYCLEHENQKKTFSFGYYTTESKYFAKLGFYDLYDKRNTIVNNENNDNNCESFQSKLLHSFKFNKVFDFGSQNHFVQKSTLTLASAVSKQEQYSEEADNNKWSSLRGIYSNEVAIRKRNLNFDIDRYQSSLQF